MNRRTTALLVPHVEFRVSTSCDIDLWQVPTSAWMGPFYQGRAYRPKIYSVHRPQRPYEKGRQASPYLELVRAPHSPNDMAKEDVPMRSRHRPALRVRKEPLVPP